MVQKHVKLIIIVFAIILVGFVGVTFAFFNYTRTGVINNLGTGRIFFSSNQSDTISLTNVFPMTNEEAGEANLDTVTIAISGDTTYSAGEEFLISLVDVENEINEKKIPINYIATYTSATGGTIGTSSDNYWIARKSQDSSIYLFDDEDTVEENKKLLVGYIASGETGINGTLTIKAYIDEDNIAITDTYPESGLGYYVNPNMSQDSIDYCVSLLLSDNWDEDLMEGETLESFCNGTGTLDGVDLLEAIDDEWLDDEWMDLFLEHNIIFYKNYYNETSEEWVDERVVLTTDEWNTLTNNPISFKIRAESNEGIWVERPDPIETCPDCVFSYTYSSIYTTWNTESIPPTVLSSSDYTRDYEDVVSESGFDFFLGYKLNSSNQVEKAYACGLRNGITPFCVEGYYDNSKYETNMNILQRPSLWNNTCYNSGNNKLMCSGTFSSDVILNYNGSVNVFGSGYICEVENNGYTTCSAMVAA